MIQSKHLFVLGNKTCDKYCYKDDTLFCIVEQLGHGMVELLLYSRQEVDVDDDTKVQSCVNKLSGDVTSMG